MSALAGALPPSLLALVVPGSASAVLDGLSAAPVWLSLAGLLGVGFRDVLGGGRRDEPVEGDDLEADFLDGEFDDDEEDDGFGDLDDGLGMAESPLDEVEPRIEDLEAEVEDVAAGISAVRGEHESMRESVEEIEEHVRKLLEVYEVVNRGMNPFADDPPAAAAGAVAADLFGAQAQEVSAQSQEAAPEPPAEDDLFADVEDEADETEEPAPAASDDDGLSFEDLKTEFEYVGDEVPGDLDVPLDEEVVEDLVEDEFALDDPEDVDAGGRPDDTGSAKPYLTALPGGYGAELLVMEWLDFLISESSMGDALRAVRYYETVDWITSDVASHLQAVLSATSPEAAGAATDGGRLAQLTVDHHTQSLEFIAELRRLADGEALPGASGDRAGLDGGRGERGVQR